MSSPKCPLAPSIASAFCGASVAKLFRARTILSLLFSCMLWLNPAYAAEHAVILLYHHVADDTPAVTSVNPAEFAGHLEYLERNGFHVLPLNELLHKLAGGSALPEKSVAITFDDGYRSVFKNAVPLLKKRGWPFAVFVNPTAIDRGYGAYMNWDELRKVRSMGGEILNHTGSHDHLIRRREGEASGEWEKRVTADIISAQRRIEDETGPAEKILAYPYGEFSLSLKRLVGELGYVGLAQQSGALSATYDSTAVPRFPIMGKYAGSQCFSERVNARPLPVTILRGADNVLAADQRRPLLRARIGEGGFDADSIRCYRSSGEPLNIKWVNRQMREFEIMSAADLAGGRSKYSCTAQALDNPRSYYWYSHLWIIPKKDGSWPKE
ncbi:polysaccharide deacetylase family protein [Mariprofundus ferrinatatus]|nr:polysaccharide deacetylase family protein [Mariprofundus ferrinatatus]